MVKKFDLPQSGVKLLFKLRFILKLYPISEIQQHAEKAIRDVSKYTRDNPKLDHPIPFHWVIVTDRIQVKHLSLTKEFNIDTLSNIKINSREILLTTSNPDGSHLVSLIEDGATDVLSMDEDVVGWNVDMETKLGLNKIRSIFHFRELRNIESH